MALLEETATEKWRRRGAIEDILNPRRASAYQFTDWAVDLALRNHWNCAAADHVYTRASIRGRVIYTPPVMGDEELALFLHEGGHLQDPDHGRHDDDVVVMAGGLVHVHSLQAEFFAWRWAMQTLAHRWNTRMQQHLETCLRSYQGIGLFARGYADLQAMNAVIAEGAELARHVVRILPSDARNGRNAR